VCGSGTLSASIEGNAVLFSKGADAFPIIRNGFVDEFPEVWTMVVGVHMAELVHYHVVGKMRGYKGDAIVKAKVVCRRAAAPALCLIADGDFAVGEVVVRIKLC